MISRRISGARIGASSGVSKEFHEFRVGVNHFDIRLHDPGGSGEILRVSPLRDRNAAGVHFGRDLHDLILFKIK